MIARIRRFLFGKDDYVSDLTSATDGYAGHWDSVPTVSYPPTDLVAKYREGNT